MEIFEKIGEMVKKVPKVYFLPLGLGCIGLILFVYGIGASIVNSHSRENNDFIDFSQAQNASPAAYIETPMLVIDVEGAVTTPGIYKVTTKGRIADALIAAGGLAENADRAWVAQHVNLAQKVVDGTKIYIPQVGEITQLAGVSTEAGGQNNTVLGTTTSGLININTATSSDLDTLPGVGAVTAGKIISGRPYSSVQDLLSKKVVGQKEFEKIQDQITVN